MHAWMRKSVRLNYLGSVEALMNWECGALEENVEEETHMGERELLKESNGVLLLSVQH